MVCPDLELCIEPQEEESETSKGGSRVSTRERSNGILYSRLIRLCADLGGVHDLVEAHSIQTSLVVRLCERNVGHANIEEVRSEAANKLFQSDLEQRGQSDGPDCSDNGIACIPNGLDSNLSEDVCNNGQRNRDQTGEPCGKNPTAIRVGPLGVDDIAGRRIESNGERSRNDDRRVVDLVFVSDASTKTDRIHTPYARAPTNAMQRRSW